MAKIENPKNYTGRDLENIFFRPMLSGPGAEELGIKVMYNTPVPTTLQFWKRAGDILQKYGTSGWSGVRRQRNSRRPSTSLRSRPRWVIRPKITSTWYSKSLPAARR